MERVTGTSDPVNARRRHAGARPWWLAQNRYSFAVLRPLPDSRNLKHGDIHLHDAARSMYGIETTLTDCSSILLSTPSARCSDRNQVHSFFSHPECLPCTACWSRAVVVTHFRVCWHALMQPKLHSSRWIPDWPSLQTAHSWCRQSFQKPSIRTSFKIADQPYHAI